MIKAKLTKILSTHENVRTKETIGETNSPPIAGQPFILFGESLTEPGVRLIHTTPVEETMLLPGGGIEFRTWNSTYRFEEIV